MIRKIEFDMDIEMRVPVPKRFRGLIGVSYRGENTYRIRAM